MSLSGNKIGITLKVPFCLGWSIMTFNLNLFRNISIETFYSHMTPESRDTLILVTWSKSYYFKNINISKIICSKIYKMSIFETYHWLPVWLGFNGVDSTCGSKSMNITFFAKFIEIMISFYKKCWRYRKTHLTEQILI